MGDAEEGFVVLVHILLGGGLVPFGMFIWLAAQPLRKLKPALKTFTPQSRILRLLVSPVRRGDMKGLKMEPNEVRPWHDPETP